MAFLHDRRSCTNPSFQLTSQQITLGNLVPCFMWSLFTCSSINLQTSALSNPVLIIHPFYMTKLPNACLLHDNRNILNAQPVSHFFRGSSTRHTNAAHLLGYMHVNILESANVFCLYRLSFSDIQQHFRHKLHRCSLSAYVSTLSMPGVVATFIISSVLFRLELQSLLMPHNQHSIYLQDSRTDTLFYIQHCLI